MKFTQLSRMKHGKEMIERRQATDSRFVDSITFCVNDDNASGFAEATISWYKFDEARTPSPRLEVFFDGIAAAYSFDFAAVISKLKNKIDFTPEECVKAFLSAGFEDLSNAKEKSAKNSCINLDAEITHFLTSLGYPSFIESWIENDVWVIQDIGYITRELPEKDASAETVFNFLQATSRKFIPELARFTTKIRNGIDSECGKEGTGTWCYYIPLVNGSVEETLEFMKKETERLADTTGAITFDFDFDSFNKDIFTVNVIFEPYEITEYCPHCETEDTIKRNCEKDGYISVCSHCNKLLLLCSECESIDNCNWSEKGCRQCTPEMFLTFLAKKYEGIKEINFCGEHNVRIPLPSGRTLCVTFKECDLKEENKHYNVSVFCSDKEAETPRFKDDPIVLWNTYTNIQNVYKMVSTIKNSNCKN